MILLPLIIDLFVPDPQTRWHPIALIGNAISWLEKRYYHGSNLRRNGLVLWLTLIFGLILLLQLLRLIPEPTSTIIRLILLFFVFSGRSLVVAGQAIAKSLENETIEKTRERLSWIVGRDAKSLSQESIIRATVETVAENTIDGLVAPVFYYYLGSLFGAGLEAAVAYKAVNTMDSMLGYKNERYQEFGYYPARLDDVFNYLPARLGSLIMLLASVILGHPVKRTFDTLVKDRRQHASPNAGYPESVVAGALGIRLGGPNYYHGQLVEKPSIGEDREMVHAEKIHQANRILQVTQILLIALGILVILLGGHL